MNELVVVQTEDKKKIVLRAARKYYKEIGEMLCLRRFQPYIKKEIDALIVDEINSAGKKKITASKLTKRMRDASSLPSKMEASEVSLILEKTLLICHLNEAGSMVLDPQADVFSCYEE